MTAENAPRAEHRRTRRLERGWRFHRGDVDDGADPELDDGDWDVVDVPHGTVAVEATADGLAGDRVSVGVVDEA